jgi:hypothetical protein
MLETLNMHEPLLVNSIGHSVGLIVFAGFLFLVVRDKLGGHGGSTILLPITAGLALAWNAGSLIALASLSGLSGGSDVVAAFSFAILSLIPAALLQLALAGTVRPIWITGWILSGLAACLHIAELARPESRLHQTALWIIVAGFGLLAVAVMFLAKRSSPAARSGGPRIAVSMCLFLFAISFVHFNAGHVRYAWSSEIALHHAGIPLALYALLQDYRFLLLDEFLRFLANSIAASAFIVLSLGLNAKFHLLDRAVTNPFLEGVLLVATGLMLVVLAWTRGNLQLLLTRVVFRRPARKPALGAIREAGRLAENELQILQNSAPEIGRFVRSVRQDIRTFDVWDERKLPAEPVLFAGSNSWSGLAALDEPWMEAFVPIRFLKGDGACILLGRREGGRRYLSEDLRELGRLAAAIAEQVEQFRNSETQRLVSQAELRALQAQINPHFLFNCLNTLYGSIPREAQEARRLVLNLAETFRYFLQQDHTFTTLSRELQIVRAYLEIERLRLGDRLKTEIEVDEPAAQAMIPILSVQPLVENAVKHGVAARSGPGTVRLRARTAEEGVLIEVSDDGAGFAAASARHTASGEGVGLENVRQRLRLCFGDSAHFNIQSSDRGSTISFLVPPAHPLASQCPPVIENSPLPA